MKASANRRSVIAIFLHVYYLSYTPQLADRAFARGIVSSSSFVEDAATPRANEMVMSAAALSKYTSSTDISRKSRKV